MSQTQTQTQADAQQRNQNQNQQARTAGARINGRKSLNGNRQIGHGVILAYVATVVVIGALVFGGQVDAIVGIGIAFTMFVMVFLGDMYVQHTDMDADGD